MFRLTLEKALEIMALHIKFYASHYPGGEVALRNALVSMTRTESLKPGVPYPYETISAHVPRAHAIVYELLPGLQQKSIYAD